MSTGAEYFDLQRFREPNRPGDSRVAELPWSLGTHGKMATLICGVGLAHLADRKMPRKKKVQIRNVYATVPGPARAEHLTQRR
jgi:hypothetical protein